MKQYNTVKDLQLISENVFECSMAGFWDWDMISDEEYLSPRFKKMFGYEDHEMENNHDSWQEIVFKEDLQPMFDLFQRHIDSKGAVPFETTIRYRHKNGRTIYVRCNGKVVEWTEDGKPARAIGSHIDITEEKELQLQLSEALSQRDFLLSEVHHRVKNNLNMILVMARLKQTEKRIELTDIEDAIVTTANAYESIYKKGEFSEIMIEDYLNRVIQPIIKDHNIALLIEADQIKKGLDFLVPIGLIISECVNNSLKHAFKTKLEKVIRLNIRKENNAIYLSYHDNGSGFDQCILNALDTLESYGIFIIKTLAEQLNGNLYLSNDNGAKIEININLSPAH
ncbi:PAS domain S-box protein [Mucilaginibacter terrenus]|uniref:histidine kinase n=1 Tax=Mucilaginibacter terrenus TaxID=2482727 RepID=A0A3E2NVW6_9SPHI|nr:PAS domain-containing protein [Mucilaginibacter terrenus]RFZ85155.1 PAS domain S-box protein [Mucilaginibacter terrenus]